MGQLKIIKAALIGSWVLAAMVWAASSSLSKAADYDKTPATANYNADDYVGTETCKTCHEDHFNSFSNTAHAKLEKAGRKAEKQGCESCHGPGKAHVEGGGDKSKIRTFEGESPKQISENCLQCHAGKEEHNNYRRGEHWRNDVGCTSCHSPHSSTRDKEAGPERKAGGEPSALQSISTPPTHSTDLPPQKMLIKTQPQLCLTCHNETKAQFTQPFHHKVLEGAMNCSDCHNPHGGFEQKQTRLATGADAACIKCHSDKQGPFVFEHAPLKVEGCTACHTPHGAGNPRLLKRNQVQQLCLECHTNTQEIGTPNTPSFHNLTTARFQNCTVCHMKIHGSNNHPFFFR
jgi:predicted CXXCH cytochrome family protein